MLTPLEPFKFIITNLSNWGRFWWITGILLFPFYFFPEGGLQISSFFFVGAMLHTFSRFGFSLGIKHKPTARFTFPFLLLVTYIFIVQSFWAISLGSTSVLFYAIYYVFSFLTFTCFIVSAKRDVDLPAIAVKAIYCAVIVQVVCSMLGVNQGTGIRSTVFFQNPNQLGYFSLISACFIAFGSKQKLIDTMSAAVGLLGCIWLAQLSLSKSAMLSGAVLMIFVFLRNPALVIPILVVGFGLFNTGVLDDRVDAVSARIESVGQDSDDNFAGRGYDRIWLHPEMLVLGGGEGAVWRWDSFLKTGEIHSSWATLLFSYGIPGFLMAFLLFARVSTSVRYHSFAPFLVIVLYGITHMGLRFTPMWLFFAMCAAVSLTADKRRQLTAAKARKPLRDWSVRRPEQKQS